MTPIIEISTSGNATNGLQKLAAEVGAPELREAVGLAGVEEVKSYYTRLDAERPNALGGQRTHFFAQAAESAQWLDQGRDGVLLDVPEPLGLRQRILGGPIVPGQGKKYLTIAACAEAYGHRAGEFSNLVPLFRRKSGKVEAFALAEAQYQDIRFKDGKTVKGKKHGGGGASVKFGGSTFTQLRPVMFWLVKAVEQMGDSSAAPDAEAVKTAAMTGVTRFFSGLQGEVSA